MAGEKVLIVDDDDANVALVSELCRSLGFVVSSARSGKAAGDAIGRDRPDVILLEIAISDDDGFALLESLKYDPRSREIPVILVTSISDIDTKLRGIELGADDFLPKPFKLYELETRIRSAIQVGLYQQKLREAQEALARGVGTDPVTGAGVYAQLHAHLDHEMTRARRYGRPLSAVLCSVESYHEAREKLGKDASDAVLREAVKQMRETIRTVDRIFRLDEAEFVLLLPETDRAGAELVSRRLGDAFAEVTMAEGGIHAVFGVAAFPDEDIRGGEDLLRSAHNAMMAAAQATETAPDD
ncbi:MAG: response regulator [Deltaproteobacteria bacterium]|nr:response regulator [Deltaproteobacteria bacterium]